FAMDELPPSLPCSKAKAPKLSPRRILFCLLPIAWTLSRNRLRRIHLVIPGVGGLERAVYVVDVLNARGVQPLLEGLGALLGIDGDAVLPGGAAAENSVEAGSAFRRQLQRLNE